MTIDLFLDRIGPTRQGFSDDAIFGTDTTDLDVLEVVFRYSYDYPIRSFRVVDRLELDQPNASARLEMSTDGVEWRTVYERWGAQTLEIDNDWKWYADQELSSDTKIHEVFFRYRLARDAGSSAQPALTKFQMQLNLDPLIPTSFAHDNLDNLFAAEPEF